MKNIAKLVVGVLLLTGLNILVMFYQEEPLASTVVLNDIDVVTKGCNTDPTKWTCGDDLYFLAEAIYFESRGEYWTGQEAVGNVIMNRVNHPAYPNTIAEVVYEGAHKKHACQFSYVCDGKSEVIRDIDSWEHSVISAIRVYHGFAKDHTNGSLFYINHDVSTNQGFFKTLEPVRKIGSHTFYTVRT